jgi:hypothetical protein
MKFISTMSENLASNQAYGRNARLLFALQTKFQIEDIDAIAAECLTCGPDDRKDTAERVPNVQTISQR